VSATTHEQARAYYELCDKARELGIAVSLDDPNSPRTVAALERRVRVLEDEIAELRDSITDLYKHVPVPEPQSLRA
jgi:hypothetical protein